MVYIYILQLENSKWYVGKTTKPDFRLDSHFNFNGSAWTNKYKPIKLHQLIPDCDDYDEDKYTKIYMDKYGINNVRGGSYVQIKLDKSTIDNIIKMSRGCTNKCFLCGKSGHFTKDCKDSKDNNEEDDGWMCGKCGKEFTTIKGLRYHQNMYCNKNKYESDDDLSGEEIEVFCCCNCDKEFDTLKGLTFHQNMYCKKNKVNKSTKQTNDNYKKDYYNSNNSKANTCYRCGRSGHYSSDCYASTHVRGYEIE